MEFHPKYIVYSKKQHLFLVVYESTGASNEIVMYWENTDSQLANSKATTVKGSYSIFGLLLSAVVLIIMPMHD